MSQGKSCWEVGVACWGWFNDWSLFWSALAALSTCFAAIATVSAVVVSLKNSKETQKLISENRYKNEFQALVFIHAELKQLLGIAQRFALLREPVLDGLKQDKNDVLGTLECRYIIQGLQRSGDLSLGFMSQLGQVIEAAAFLKQKLITVQQLWGLPNVELDLDAVQDSSRNLLKSIESLPTYEDLRAQLNEQKKAL